MGGRRWRRAVVVVVATGVLAVGCGGGGDDKGAGPTASVGGVSTVLGAAEATTTTLAGPQATTTTTFVGDPYAVPEVIDEAYVNRVLAGLDQALGDIDRMVVTTKSVPREALERLQALYKGNYLQLAIDGYQEDLAEGFVGYKPLPGNRQSNVRDLLSASGDCIFAAVDRDLSAVSSLPDLKVTRVWVGLIRLDPARNALHGNNQTPWMYVVDGFKPDSTAPTNPCIPAS